MSLEKRLPSQNTQHRTTQYFTELSNKFLEKKGGGGMVRHLNLILINV